MNSRELPNLELNDRTIESLLRMAGEIERLESGLEQELPVFRIEPARRDPLRLMRVAGLGALAAGVLLAGVVSLKLAIPSPTVVSPGPGLARLGTNAASTDAGSSTQLVAGESEQSCVVLTVFRGNEGECKCVQMQTHDLDDRSLEELPRAELLKLALDAPCSTTAQRVLILAVSGSADAMPKTREDVEALARQFEHSEDPTSTAYAAIPRLSPNATVIAETVAWKRASLPMPGFPTEFR